MCICVCHPAGPFVRWEMPPKKSRTPPPLSAAAAAADPCSWLKMSSDGTAVLITVRAKPGSRQSAITGESEDGLEVAVGAPPREGEANAELCSFMAQLLGTRKGSVAVETGGKSRSKTVSVRGLAREVVYEKLRSAVKHS